MILNKGTISSAIGLGIPMAYNFGLVRLANKLSEVSSSEFRLDEYLELSLWAALLQVCFYFGGNDYFAYLSINKNSKAKKSAIIHNVNITLWILLCSVVILALLIIYIGIQYWPLLFILILMNLRIFIHFVLSSSGSYHKDFGANISDLILFVLLVFLNEIEVISLDDTVIFAVVLSLCLTCVQFYNYFKIININSPDNFDIIVNNKRVTFFFKEILSFFTANFEQFILLYLLRPNSEVFVEYNVLLRISLLSSIIIRYLSKNATLDIIKLPDKLRSNALRRYQLKSLLIITIIYMFILVTSPLLMNFFAGIEKYSISILTVLVLATPVFRSFYTWNIYFNLKGANHLLNHLRVITSIISILSIVGFGYFFGVIGLVIGSILTALISMLLLIYLERKTFDTLFFE